MGCCGSKPQSRRRSNPDAQARKISLKRKSNVSLNANAVILKRNSRGIHPDQLKRRAWRLGLDTGEVVHSSLQGAETSTGKVIMNNGEAIPYMRNGDGSYNPVDKNSEIGKTILEEFNQ